MYWFVYIVFPIGESDRFLILIASFYHLSHLLKCLSKMNVNVFYTLISLSLFLYREQQKPQGSNYSTKEEEPL